MNGAETNRHAAGNIDQLTAAESAHYRPRSLYIDHCRWCHSPHFSQASYLECVWMNEAAQSAAEGQAEAMGEGYCE